MTHCEGGCGRDVDDLTDYCAECSKNLCDECMALGCCGNVPALSGMDVEYGPEGDPE